MCALVTGVQTCALPISPSTSLLTPQIAVPQNFEVSGNEKSAPLDRWWDNFDDPQLSSLIQTALTDSTDARTAYFRIREARALRDQAVAETWPRSEEHMSELQSLMSISHAVFCVKKKTQNITINTYIFHDVNI